MPHKIEKKHEKETSWKTKKHASLKPQIMP